MKTDHDIIITTIYVVSYQHLVQKSKKVLSALPQKQKLTDSEIVSMLD